MLQSIVRDNFIPVFYLLYYLVTLLWCRSGKRGAVYTIKTTSRVMTFNHERC